MEVNKEAVPTTSVPPPTPVIPNPQKKSMRNIYLLLALLIFFGLAALVPTIAPYFLKKEVPQEIVQTPLFLALDSPKAQTTVVNGELLVKGRTLPKTTVVVYSDTDETSLLSDSKGVFEGTVVVGEQGGLVRITAFADNGEELSKTIEVGESNALGESNKAGGKDKENNSKGNSGNNNKEEKENQKQEEKTQNQNQNENQNREIKTETGNKVKDDKFPNVADFLGNKVKIEKPQKIGVGRMVEILSQESSPESSLGKDLKRKNMEIKQASSEAQLKRHAVAGVIIDISGGVITLAHQIQRERTYTIYFNNSTEISMKDNNSTESAGLSSELSIGMRIAVVGIPTDTGLIATRIHVIPGKAVGVFRKQPVATTSATPIISITPMETATPEATRELF